MTTFKTGDKVRFKRGFTPLIGMANEDYAVTHFDGMYPEYTIAQSYVNGWATCVKLEGFSAGVFPERLELVKAPSKPQVKFIVVLEENGGLKPSHSPMIHTAFDLASKEAKRLADTLGGRFYVFETAAYAEAPKRPAAELVMM